MAFTIKSIFPRRILGALIWVLTPKRIKIKAPIKPSPIPIDFILVIRSFKKKAESRSSKTGTKVITTELFIGVERLINPTN